MYQAPKPQHDPKLGPGSRAALVSEAESWLGTRYELGQHVKGAGCDCGTFLIEVMVFAGVITRAEADKFYSEVGFYSHDWFCNTTVQRYLLAMARFGRQVYEGRCYATTRTEPGNLLLTKAGSVTQWTHGGIVLKWPWIAQCCYSGVRRINAARDPMWAGQELVIFDPVG